MNAPTFRTGPALVAGKPAQKPSSRMVVTVRRYLRALSQLDCSSTDLTSLTTLRDEDHKALRGEVDVAIQNLNALAKLLGPVPTVLMLQESTFTPVQRGASAA